MGENTLVRSVQKLRFCPISVVRNDQNFLPLLQSENVVSNYKISFRAEWNVNKLSFWPNCALSDKSTKIGRGRFVCFELTRINPESSSRIKIFLATTIPLTKFLSLWICTINRALITVINPGILNSGPYNSLNTPHLERNNALTIHYQNVQGLIPFGCLSDKNPLLDFNKIYELQTHVDAHKPDIIILNETWLKETINDSEILSCEHYKIFRCD